MPAFEFTGVRRAAEAHDSPRIFLATCQRIEVYSRGACACTAPARLRGREALVHLSAVAAGLEAAMPGETQVLGQVRAAMAGAPCELRGLAGIALAAARELRREMPPATDAGELLDRALDLRGVEASGTLLVLGSGQMGRAVAHRGLRLGFAEVIVASRRSPSWIREPIRYVPLDAVSTLERVAVAAGCLGPEAGEIEASRAPSCGLLVDLATPRNFASTPGTGPEAVTIAELLAARPEDEAVRLAALHGQLNQLVSRRVAMMAEDAHTPLGRMRAAAERIRVQEAARIRRLHPEIPDTTIDSITVSLVNQLLHRPTQRLRAEGDAAFGVRVAALFAAEAG